jgi:WD40 repeat protein
MRATTLADIVCQVINRDRSDRIEFIWSAGGGFFDPYIVEGTELTELRTTADQVRDVLETLVVALNRTHGQMEAIPWELSYEFAEAGSRLFNDILPSENSTAKIVRRWLERLHAQSGVVTLEIVVEEDPDQAERFLAIPWNLVYDQRPVHYKNAFQTGQGVERWRPFWAIRYNLASGRRVDPWRRLSDWTDPRVVAVIDPKARQGLRAEERRDLEVFLKEFGFEPISASSPPGKPNAKQLRTQVSSLDELEAALEAGYPSLLYWLGHAQPDHLLLGDERISPADLRNLLRTYDDRDRPEGMLAFLNACRTAEPGSRDSFLRVLHRFGFAGAIVAERQIIDNFANRFGLKFLRGFLQDGKPLGTLLHELRLKEAPLGLLYGAHCPPEIRVWVGPESASAPPEIRTAQPVTGRPLDASLAAPGRRAETLTLPDQPYRSLAYYDYADRLLFSGRDADVVRFAATLDRPDTRILVLHGESGIGKSSLLRAGVIPYLEEECVGYRFLRDAAGQVVIMQASKDPVGRLAAGLLAMTERPLEYRTPTGDVRTIDLRLVLDEALGTAADADTLRATLMADPGLLAVLLERLSAPLPHALMLVLDQAEELFTLAKEPWEITARDQALRLLQRVADVRADVKVIISLRTEYFGRLLDHMRAGRRDLTGVRNDLLRDFSRSALIAAIERPTLETPLVEGQLAPRERYGLTYADGVAGAIAYGVLKLRSENQDSVLPLVQVICTRLYDRAVSAHPTSRVVAQDDLDAIGGVEGGLKAFAEDALERSMGLGPEDLDAFKEMYAQLYTRQADGTLTTWLKPLARLESAWSGSRPFSEILESACERRMLREDVLRIEGEEPQSYVRLGHDALAKVAAAWRAEREEHEQLQRVERDKHVQLERERKRRRLLIGGLVASSLVAVVLALLGLQIHQNNRALDEKNRELYQAKEEAQKNRAKAEDQERLARARLARSVFDQVDGLWRTWPERGKQLLEDEKNFRSSERDFTWGYYFRLCDRVRVLEGHRGVVNRLAFSPDGKFLASSGGNLLEPGELLVWDAATGDRHATLTGHQKEVLTVAYSHDGKTLASAGLDGKVLLWDAPTCKLRASLEGHTDTVHVLKFSPDREILASFGNDKSVRLWDVATGKCRATLKGLPYIWSDAVEFSPDGRTLTFPSDPNTMKLLDTATYKPRVILDRQEHEVRCVAFSPDGKTLATAGYSPEVRLWDVPTGTRSARLNAEDELMVDKVAFSPDGKALAACSTGQVKLWNMATRKIRTTLTGSGGTVTFSPDGSFLASAGDDMLVRLWDASTGTPRATLKGHTSRVTCVSISPSGQILATSGGYDHRVRLWDTETREPCAVLKAHKSGLQSIDFSPDGMSLAAADRQDLVIWDVATGTPRANLKGNQGEVRCLTFSPDGKILASVGVDGTVRLWDASTGTLSATLEGHKGEVWSLTFSPDGKILASVGGDGTVRLWNASTGMLSATLKGHEGIVWAVTFSRDGKTLASSGGELRKNGGTGELRLWDVATGTPRATLEGHKDSVRCLAFSPNGKTLASADVEGTIRLWNARFPSDSIP